MSRTLVDVGPNSGTSLDELQRDRRAWPLPRGPRTGDPHAPALDHLGLVSGRAHAGAEVAAIDLAVPVRRELLARGAGRRRLRPQRHAPTRNPRERRDGAPGRVTGVTCPGGARGYDPAPFGMARSCGLGTSPCGCTTGRGTAPPTRASMSVSANPHRRRPPDQAHLVEPDYAPTAASARQLPGIAPADV
jgi:hypothetical protein